MADRSVFFRDLGLIGYQQAWDYQESLLHEGTAVKMAGRPADTVHRLLFCTHPPVFTLGKSGHPENLLVGQDTLREKAIEFFHTNRGGDITFHGPGQIVGYPIIDLEKLFRDIGRYLRSLEEVIILTLAEYGIAAGRSPGETGVWIDPGIPGKARKICAMGVRCSRWITMHGFALNVNTDLAYFSYIVPCGIADKQVTSMERELGAQVAEEEVKEKLKKHFGEVFGLEVLDATYLSTESPI
jgi:lipoyl(octanoyl) transferase